MSKRWYVVHAYSSFEKHVMRSLIERVKMYGMEDRFGEILVPTEEVVEMRDGKRRKSERKFYPGYVLVEMEMDDATWHLVNETPRVLGFIGGTKEKPAPISQKEADAIPASRPGRHRQATAEDSLRAGSVRARYRWPLRRLQWCGRRSQLRQESRSG